MESPRKCGDSFRDRIREVLGERRPHPWGRQVAQSSGGLYRMLNKGEAPGWRGLLVIAKVENVALTWLLDGSGQAYTTLPAHTDREASAHLDRLLREAYDWCLTVASGLPISVIVLDAPRELEIDQDTRLPYRRIHVIAGRLGPLTMQHAAAAATRHQVRTIDLSEDELAEIAEGRAGTLRLFGDEDHPGLLAGAEPLNTDAVAELSKGFESEVPSEAKLRRIYRGMAEGDRSKLLRVAEALAQPPAPKQ